MPAYYHVDLPGEDDFPELDFSAAQSMPIDRIVYWLEDDCDRDGAVARKECRVSCRHVRYRHCVLTILARVASEYGIYKNRCVVIDDHGDAFMVKFPSDW